MVAKNRLLDENQAPSDIEILTNPMTILDKLTIRAGQNPEFHAYTFLKDEAEYASHLTWQSLQHRAKAIAAVLQQQHAKNKAVLLLFEPGTDYICAFFACLYAGAIAVPAYPPLSGEMASQLLHIMENAKVSITLTNTKISGRLRTFKRIAPFIKLVKNFLPAKFSHHGVLDSTVTSLYHSKLIEVDSISEKLYKEFKSFSIHLDDIAYLQYTSGSTSQPKGVIITHRNLMANLKHSESAFEATPRDILVNWLPPYHDMGLISSILLPVYSGFKTFHMSPFDFLKNPFQWLQTLSKYKATVTGGPDFAYRLCNHKITPAQKKQLNLHHLRTIFCGAEKIHAETFVEFYDKFKSQGLKSHTLFPCYGLAEAIVFVSGVKKSLLNFYKTFDRHALSQGRAVLVDPKHSHAKKMVSVGHFQDDCLVEIVDPETGLIQEPNCIGEIWVSGPHVVEGYWQNKEATKAAMKAKLKQHPKLDFLRTGDLGFIFEGELFISGRIKDMIIISGVNHYPHDIEIDIENHTPHLRPGCIAAFAIEKESSEGLIILAEVKPGPTKKMTKKDYEQIVQQIKISLSKHHHLVADEIILLPPRTLSKTTSGKLRRNQCKLLYEEDKLSTLYKMNGTHSVVSP
ncbi:MAG: fatty acyl-AMP ligase [Gammaproteobacteria bacterium]|nr:fatty acyl-AMP ligase [Gammaproteobacteria bacterium]